MTDLTCLVCHPLDVGGPSFVIQTLSGLILAINKKVINLINGTRIYKGCTRGVCDFPSTVPLGCLRYLEILPVGSRLSLPGTDRRNLVPVARLPQRAQLA